MDDTVLKAQIDSEITNKTTPKSVTPTILGVNMKAIVDYIAQEIESITPIPAVYKALLIKSGSVFTLNVLEDTLPGNLIASVSGANCVITESAGANFLSDNTIIKIVDTSYLNTVVTKYSKDSLNQITIYTYYEGFQNINFSTELQIEIYKY